MNPSLTFFVFIYIYIYIFISAAGCFGDGVTLGGAPDALRLRSRKVSGDADSGLVVKVSNTSGYRPWQRRSVAFGPKTLT